MKSDISSGHSGDPVKKQKNKFSSNRKTMAVLLSMAIGLLGCILYPYQPKIALIAIAVAIYGVLLTVINGKVRKQVKEDRKKYDAGMLQITVTAADYEWSDYHHVESVYTALGFENIETVNLKDLKTGLIKRPGMVKSVTVNGVKPGKDEWYPKDAQVVICYHGMASE